MRWASLSLIFKKPIGILRLLESGSKQNQFHNEVLHLWNIIRLAITSGLAFHLEELGIRTSEYASDNVMRGFILQWGNSSVSLGVLGILIGSR